MIITEIVELDGQKFIFNHSSFGYQIEREDGVIFDEAYDVADSTHTYTEVVTDEEATDKDYEMALSQLGVEV